MSEEKQKVPVWGYRKNGDEVESKVFHTTDGKLPNGWKDTPAGLKNEA